MLKCAGCGTLIHDQAKVCGVCGSTRLYPPDQIQPHVGVEPSPQRKQSWAKAILVLAIGAVVSAGGGLLVLQSQLGSRVMGIGALVFVFGILILTSGVGISLSEWSRSRGGWTLGRKNKGGKEQNEREHSN